MATKKANNEGVTGGGGGGGGRRVKVRLDDFVARLVPNPNEPPETLLLSGFLGASSEEAHVRLYLDEELSQYVEIPQDAIVHAQEIPPEQSPLGGSIVWIERKAEVLHGKVGTERTRASFLEGQIAQDYISGGAVAAAGAAAAAPAGGAAAAAAAPALAAGRTGLVWCTILEPRCQRTDVGPLCPVQTEWACPQSRDLNCPSRWMPCPKEPRLAGGEGGVEGGEGAEKPGGVAAEIPKTRLLGCQSQYGPCIPQTELQSYCFTRNGILCTRLGPVCRKTVFGPACQQSVWNPCITHDIECQVTGGAPCEFTVDPTIWQQGGAGGVQQFAAGANAYTQYGCTRSRPVCYPTEVCTLVQPACSPTEGGCPPPLAAAGVGDAGAQQYTQGTPCIIATVHPACVSVHQQQCYPQAAEGVLGGAAITIMPTQNFSCPSVLICPTQQPHCIRTLDFTCPSRIAICPTRDFRCQTQDFNCPTQQAHCFQTRDFGCQSRIAICPTRDFRCQTQDPARCISRQFLCPTEACPETPGGFNPGPQQFAMGADLMAQQAQVFANNPYVVVQSRRCLRPTLYNCPSISSPCVSVQDPCPETPGGFGPGPQQFGAQADFAAQAQPVAGGIGAIPQTRLCVSQGVYCPSAVDACPTRYRCPSVHIPCINTQYALCRTRICPTRYGCESIATPCYSQFAVCETVGACPSAVDACPSRFGCDTQAGCLSTQNCGGGFDPGGGFGF